MAGRVRLRPSPRVAIIKHANPCGIAVGADVAEAHRKAHACDPVSAFGGVIAVNRPVTVALAEQIAEIFTEVVVAPAFERRRAGGADRKKNIRLLRCARRRRRPRELRPIDGGAAGADRRPARRRGRRPGVLDAGGGRAASPTTTLADLAFAWRACRAVKSNAILLATDGATVGVGMGQVNRVDSAGWRWSGPASGPRVVAASDAFFPFPDGLQVLLEAGVRAVVQPGGSVRDEVVAAAEEAGVTMYFTGTRHFFH